ncbi:MAG: peptidoglycan DD-metalloendopeptidase family protein [Archangiaceae bacterium]|nr:peptidoglycan DD-metalloendopeptidase family protein [Archangiaceae bacterium]
MNRLLSLLPLVALVACGIEQPPADLDGTLGDAQHPDIADPDDTAAEASAVICNARMRVFPVAASHNIGYDAASCGSGTCKISCPDQHANSDWGGDHHGIDVFAFHRAPLVAVADGTVVAVGVIASSGVRRVKVRDACGWEYYYGHLDQTTVALGQRVSAGQLVGYMGRSGTSSTHLHFNVSGNGYYNDINPINLLKATSATACGGSAPPPPVTTPPPAPAPTGCGVLGVGATLAVNQALTSCDGRFTLVMQGDGNLVIYWAGHGALWSSKTPGSGGALLAMQGDGNLVIYRANGTAVWHTHTFGKPGAVLAMQTDGNLVVYQGSKAVWSSGTYGH